MKLPSNYLNVLQGSPEWLQARIGCVTASRVKDVVAKLKNGKESAARASYKLELLTEFLTGRATEHYVTAAMEFGIENEPLARSVYEIKMGLEVESVGYVLHPCIKRSGASPDGLVGKHGIVEFKVPTTPTHLTYLLAGVMPEDYIPQVQWQLACTGRDWCDFVSYDPRLPEEFGFFTIRVERNDEMIGAMEREVETFIAELKEMCGKLLKHKEAAEQNVPGVPKAEIPAFQG
jgi:hypothetical protein